MCDVPVVEAGAGGLTAFISAAAQAKYRRHTPNRAAGRSETGERSEAPTEGSPGRKAGTDHAAVVHGHRHGKSGRIPPGKLRKAAQEARKRGSRCTKNFG